MGMIGYLVRVSDTELNSFLKDSSLFEKKIHGEQKNYADLDKAWCGIFYLLTGCEMEEFNEAEPPLSWTFFSQQIVDENQDLGYGPAQYVNPEQVKEVNKALSAITAEVLMEKYNAEDMNDAELYPGGWELGESREYISYHFSLMKNLYREAAENNEAVISYIS